MKSLKNNNGSTLLFVLIMMTVLSLTIISFQTASVTYANKSYTDRLDKQAYLSARSVVDSLFVKLSTNDPSVDELLDLMKPNLDTITVSAGAVTQTDLENAFNSWGGDVLELEVEFGEPDGLDYGVATAKVEQVGFDVNLSSNEVSVTYRISAEATVGENTSAEVESISADISFTFALDGTTTTGPSVGDDGNFNELFYFDYFFGQPITGLTATVGDGVALTDINDIELSAIEDNIAVKSPFIFTGKINSSASIMSEEDIIIWGEGTIRTAVQTNYNIVSDTNIVLDNADTSAARLQAGENVVLRNVRAASQIVAENLYIYDEVAIDSVAAFATGYDPCVLTGDLVVYGKFDASRDIYADTVTIKAGADVAFASASMKIYANNVIIEDGANVSSATFYVKNKFEAQSGAKISDSTVYANEILMQSGVISTSGTKLYAKTSLSVGNLTDFPLFFVASGGTFNAFGSTEYVLQTTAYTGSEYNFTAPDMSTTLIEVPGRSIPTWATRYLSGSVTPLNIAGLAELTDGAYYYASGSLVISEGSYNNASALEKIYIVVRDGTTLDVDDTEWLESIHFILEGNAVLNFADPEGGTYYVYGESISDTTSIDSNLNTLMRGTVDSLHSYWQNSSATNSTIYSQYADIKTDVHSVIEAYSGQMSRITTNGSYIYGNITAGLIYANTKENGSGQNTGKVILQRDTNSTEAGTTTTTTGTLVDYDFVLDDAEIKEYSN